MALRKLIASTFVSLDGVMQAPGGPHEDPTRGFTLGGWLVDWWDPQMGEDMRGLDGKDRELLLGRRTYEIFEAHWPHQPADDPTAATLNAARKHVASRTLKSLAWNNSTLLGGDAVAAVRALKEQPGLPLQIIGSSGLIQPLQRAGLIDEFNLYVFPVVLGRGKRLFEPGAKAQGLRLVSSRTFGSGAMLVTYELGGAVRPGSFADQQPSARELERRAKLAKEEARDNG